MTKNEVVEMCQKHMQAQIDRLSGELNELQESNKQNTKSSAGDKHETARAMVHLEIEKLGHQLAIAESILADLNKIRFDIELHEVKSGALVETNKGLFLIGASCGKVILENGFVFGVSLDSPLSKAIQGKKVNEQFNLNGNKFEIKSIL